MKNMKWCVITALGFALLAGRATAEDIDIYSSNRTITPGAPNVLIVLDNTANWSQSFSGSTKFAAEKMALTQVINALNTQFNLGVMMFTETGSPNTNTDGGYVRFAIQAMTDGAGAPTNARNCLLTMIGGSPSPACSGPNTTYYTNLDIIADKSNGGKGGVSMGEAYRYFAGTAAYAGNNKIKADPRAFTSGTIAGPIYQSPVVTNECQKNFIIVINNGPFSDNSSDTTTATTQLAGVGGSTAVINPPDNGTSNNNEADEWTRFLNLSDVQAITYTVEVGPSLNGGGPYNTALLQSMGRQGKGGYYAAIDAQTLLDALTRIFNDIQAVNSVFASASLPLSADNSGAFANQVYMGVFRPDSNGNPRWVGNLKQYMFKADANKNLTFVGADNLPAGGASGFAQPNAVSFWTSKDTTKAPDAPLATATSATTGSTGGFYWFDSKGAGLSFDKPDGEYVEKGGAAQQLRLAYLGYGNRGGIGDLNSSSLNGKPARQVFTCTGSCLTPPSSGAAFTAFDSGNGALTTSAFGINTTVSISGITSTQAVTSIQAGGTAQAASALNATTSLVTVDFGSNHGYSTGDKITIANSTVAGTNGTFTITKTTNKQFTYVVSLAVGGPSAAGVTATKAGTTATVTTSGSPPHNLSAGASVVIAGANCNGSVAACSMNGTFTIASSPAPTATSFTYSLSTGVGATALGGITVKAKVARVFADTTGYTLGDSVTIAGAACASGCDEYNGTFSVSNLQAGSFDYTYTTSPTTKPPLDDAPGGTTVTATNTTAANAKLAILLKWIRGQDTKDENGFKVAGANTDVRASIHGDVLHTRPVVINYGTPSTADNVYVFYGGNDGVFRAVKGGQLATDGNEQWAFIPREFFPKFLRLYDNSPAVLYPSTPTGIVATKRDYFWDGPVGSYVKRNPTTGAVTKAVIYLAARRGGRFIYALDVTTVGSPKVLWRKGCTSQTDDTTCDTGFAELGQTWSLPTVATVHNGTDSGRAVVFFGAGYDTAEDNEASPPSADTHGRAIYALDALTGDLLWSGGQNTGAPIQYSAGITFGIAADLLVSDKNQDGFSDRIYAADLGGNVWRVDINDADMNNWKVWHIAAVGDRSSAATTRKFMFSPDAVFGDNFDAVVIGSGDREHPLDGGNAAVAQNRVYMFEDPNLGFDGGDLGATAGAGLTEADLQDVTGGDDVGPTKKGWFMDLLPGEKVINGPLVLLSGAMVFGTNQPDTSDNSCTGNLGIARRYDINYLTGAASANGFVDSEGQPARFEVAEGGGFLPSPVAGVVEIDGQRYMFAIDNPLGSGPIPNEVLVEHDRFRTYWHEIIE
jgi:type IV pilus assembly protein PilY1